MVRRLLAAGLVSAAFAWGESAAAGDSNPRADWVITLTARRALWGDPALAGLNLGVRVRDGSALVWGPVLSEDQAAEAVARLRLVPGVREVVSELYVLPAENPLRQKLPVAMTGKNHQPAVRAVPAEVVAHSSGPGPGVRAITSDPRGLVEDVRRQQRRFDGLKVEWNGGTAVIAAPPGRAADATAFADRIRGLPGVQRVLLRTEAAP
jgi:BON domain